MTVSKYSRRAPAAFALLVSLSLFGTSFASASKSALVQDDDTLEWLDDYDEAFALAKRTGQPVFLEFRCAP